MHTEKYGRTYHYPFSPGTSSDDRIQYDYLSCLQQMDVIVHTEKLDGENNCLNRYGVFARSHAAPTTSPWTASIRERWHTLRHDLGDLEIFGESLYAIHSLEYRRLPEHYYVFAIRCLDMWLSWEEVEFYAAAFDLPTVPVLLHTPNPGNDATLRATVIALATAPSVFDAVDVATGTPSSREGIVSRNVAEYPTAALGENVFKYVRKGHVKTDAHWTRHWKRAALLHEQKQPEP